MWKNIVEPDRRVRIACWIPKATNTHLEYVIFIALQLQQLLQECTSMLSCMYIACIVNEYIDLLWPLSSVV